MKNARKVFLQREFPYNGLLIEHSTAAVGRETVLTVIRLAASVLEANNMNVY